jgi:hypothetical protein
MTDPKENERRREILQRIMDKWAAEYNQRQAERAAALRARESDSEGRRNR